MKSTHFLAVQMTFTLERFYRLYIREIVQLHGVPVSIVSDRVSHPIPDPTRLTDPNRVQGVRLSTGTLIDRFFLRAELVPVVIQTIFVITKIIIYI